MKKIIKFFVIFIILSYGVQAEFEKLDKIEIQMFGYKSAADKSLDERVSALEIIVTGESSEGNIDGRIKKISDFILNDGIYLSPLTKTGDIEWFLFKKRADKLPLIERVENIETFLFKKIDNKQSITARITRIYNYLLETREEIVLSGDIFKKKKKIKLNMLTDISKSEEGKEVFFTLAEDITGIAKSGSKVRAKVLRKEKKGKDEIIKVMIYEIINEELREINIYKKAEITVRENKKSSGYEIEEIGIIG